jgi:CDGSH-type Zn-finger protein
METSLNKIAQRHQLSSAESTSAAAATPEVCQHAEHSVTLCPCGKLARRTFCSGACRQAAYRKSTAHTDNLKRLRDARRARRADYYQRRNRSRALAPVRSYSGPVADGVPGLGALKLENYLGEKTLHA